MTTIAASIFPSCIPRTAPHRTAPALQTILRLRHPSGGTTATLLPHMLMLAPTRPKPATQAHVVLYIC